MRTKAYRKKLMADLKSATENWIESIEKTHATENEKKFVGQCNESSQVATSKNNTINEQSDLPEVLF